MRDKTVSNLGESEFVFLVMGNGIRVEIQKPGIVIKSLRVANGFLLV